jgi:hypothetical protein
MHGCANTLRVARVSGLGREEVMAARVFMWWRVGVYMPLAPTLIFLEHSNGLPHHRLISTLIRLGSNPYMH